jgi:hypothetical protein
MPARTPRHDHSWLFEGATSVRQRRVVTCHWPEAMLIATAP